jgi:peroxiredoxin
MDAAPLVARLILALIFAVSGAAKLADLAGSRRAAADFGLPRALAAPVGTLLPFAELALAAALLPTATARWAALGALGLLAAFTVAIGLALARGRRPECRCFGRIAAEPIGWRTLARNGVLLLLAGLAAWLGPGPSALGWLGGLSSLELVLLAGTVAALLAAVGGSWLLLQVMAQNGRMLQRLEALESRLADGAATPAEPPARPGLPVGAPAPTFALPGLFGETLTLEALRAPGKPVLLVFVDPDCGPCGALMPELGRWQRDEAARLTVALISRGGVEANRDKSTAAGLTNVLLQRDWEVHEQFLAQGTPSAALVRADGTIGGGIAVGPSAIRALVAEAIGAATPPSVQPVSAADAPASTADTPAPTHPPLARLEIGDPAPPVRLPDLRGRPVDLADLRGTPLLLVFWSPTCGHCAGLLPELRAWEAAPRPGGLPKLVVVSTGSVEANRALGFRGPVLLDDGPTTMAAFGVRGTPMGVLVDARGRVASELGVGSAGVMALARAAAPAPSGPRPGALDAAAATRPPPERPAPATLGETPELGLPAGVVTQDFELPDARDGRKIAISDFRGAPLLLLFVGPDCPGSLDLLPRLRPALARPGAPLAVVVSTGDVALNRALAEAHGLAGPWLVQADAEVAALYQLPGTPAAYLIDERGLTLSPVARGAEAVRALAAGEALAPPPGPLTPLRAIGPIARAGLPAGAEAPPFRLPGLDAGEVALESYRGRRLLLVFVDPACQPCAGLPRLLGSARLAGVEVALVGRGDPAANRAWAAAEGVGLPFALQRGWELSRGYGAAAAPAAFLIDQAGRIERSAAIGRQQILDLLSDMSHTAADGDLRMMAREPEGE